MRALVADRHDLFRQSLTFLLGELPESPSKIIEAGCFHSFFEELTQFNYDLILLGTNIFTNHNSANSDILQVRHHHPETPLVLIEELEQPEPARLSCESLPIDDVLYKTSSSHVFKETIGNLVSSSPCTRKTLHKKNNNTANLYTGRAAKLTPRQQEVLKLLAFGRSNREIATLLRLSEGTVKVHVTAILRAFDVRNRTQAMLMARRLMEKSQH